MAERIRLDNPGQRVEMTPTAVTVESIKGFDYAKFTDGEVEFLAPLSSIAKQLERVGAETLDDLVGRALVVGRSDKVGPTGKPYWNIDLAHKARLARPAKAPVPPPQPRAHDGARSRAALAAAYRWALTEARTQQMAALGPEMVTADSVQAGAATLLIQAERTGLLFVAPDPMEEPPRGLTAPDDDDDLPF